MYVCMYNVCTYTYIYIHICVYKYYNRQSTVCTVKVKVNFGLPCADLLEINTRFFLLGTSREIYKYK